MATTIILVRHGETDWNREGRYQGKRDIPLNERGREQARALAEGLKGVRFDAAWASPLSRARDTALAVLEKQASKLELGSEPGLAEIDHGEWEGLLASEVAERWPGMLESWRASPHTVQMPGGETAADVQGRAVRAIRKLVAECEGRTLLVAAHDAVNKALLCWASQAPLSSFWRFKQDSTALNCLQFEGAGEELQPRIVLVNSVAHMGRLLSGIEHRAL